MQMCEADSLKYEGVSTQDYAFLTKAGFCGPPHCSPGRVWYTVGIQYLSNDKMLFQPKIPVSSLHSSQKSFLFKAIP